MSLFQWWTLNFTRTSYRRDISSGLEIEISPVNMAAKVAIRSNVFGVCFSDGFFILYSLRNFFRYTNSQLLARYIKFIVIIGILKVLNVGLNFIDELFILTYISYRVYIYPSIEIENSPGNMAKPEAIRSSIYGVCIRDKSFILSKSPKHFSRFGY